MTLESWDLMVSGPKEYGPNHRSIRLASTRDLRDLRGRLEFYMSYIPPEVRGPDSVEYEGRSQSREYVRGRESEKKLRDAITAELVLRNENRSLSTLRGRELSLRGENPLWE